MSEFIPPTIGSKLGEHKITFKSRFNRALGIWAASLLGVSLIIGGYTFWGVGDSSWVLYAMSVVFFYFGGVLIFLLIKKLNNQSRGNIFILYLVDKGVDINKEFIPFSCLTKFDGIVMFKLDGDYLRLKTEGAAFIDVADDLSEADLRFKIDPKYLANKEHLLTHLNNLIKENLEN